MAPDVNTATPVNWRDIARELASALASVPTAEVWRDYAANDQIATYIADHWSEQADEAGERWRAAEEGAERDSWPNPETRAVHLYLANKTHVMLQMREAAREYFHSPYRHCNEGKLYASSSQAKSFAEYAQQYVERVTSPQSDPGHDADETLRMTLMQLAVSRVEWGAISAWWHSATRAECEVHGVQL